MKDAHADAVSVPVSSRPTLFADYIALTKPRLNSLVVATSAAGYYLGASGPVDARPMLLAALGTALVASGAAVLNQVYERDADRLMTRTRMRPLPDGRVSTAEAMILGIVLAGIGVALLAMGPTLLPTALALSTLTIYLFVYTPLKRRTPWATLVGAVPGALPPLIGWTAGHGTLSTGGLALAAIIFFWQIPHFMAIAWLYRDDYAKAGFPMLPVIDPIGRRAGRQAVLYAIGLVAVSLLPTISGVSGQLYAAAAVLLGIGLLVLSAAFAASPTDRSARWLFLGSIIYLPLAWAMMIADRL